MPRSHLDSRADADSIAAASAWTLPGQRHPAPAATVHQVDLAALHPLAHRMGEALELLALWHKASPLEDYTDAEIDRLARPGARPRYHATRALLRDAGLLPPA